MAHVNITSYRTDGAHVGIYQHGEQDGGAFVDAAGGIVLLSVTDHDGDRHRNYIVNLDDLSVTEA